MAWARNVLRVNLTEGTCTNEPLNMEWAQKYLGQRGLATKYLVEETDPRVDPLSPDNKMIMTTGPLTGTCASTAGRYSIVTKGALTGAIACSNSGGFFGNEMKNAGFDMIIFEGRSPNPVYLLLENDNARLLDAADYWGKSVWDTEEGIKARHQDPLIRVASIGVAGEKGVKFACVVNDMHRAAGRSGVGTVMGSKNLKAVAIRGTLGVSVDDVGSFMQATAEGKKILAENAVTGQGLPAYGTQVLMNVINEVGALPTHNHRDVQFDGAKNISAEAMAEPARRRQAQPGDQRRLLRLHHRLRAHLHGRAHPLHGGRPAAIPDRLRRPRIRGRVGAGRGHGRRRSRRADLRQLHLQRAGDRPDLLRCHRRRRHGAL